MKNYIKFIGVITIAFITSCNQDPVVFDNVNGQTAVSFTAINFEESIPTEGKTITIPVQVTTVSTESRSYSVSVVEASDPTAFTLGEVVIPADSYDGELVVNISFAEIGGMDGDLRTAIIQLTPSGDATAYSDVATINYFRAIVCNDVTLFIQADRWGGETGFYINDDMGNRVYTMPVGSLANVPAGAPTTSFTADIFLEDGCYEAVITDSYGDGQVDGSNPNGSYTITCSILTFATGGGVFTASPGPSSQSRSFCVNQ
jgi:hypothetical protein